MFYHDQASLVHSFKKFPEQYAMIWNYEGTSNKGRKHTKMLHYIIFTNNKKISVLVNSQLKLSVLQTTINNT
jgi:hypothetical protein